MKYIFTILTIALILSSCKNENKEREPISSTTTVTTNELTVAQKIANAHGFQAWENVDQITFRFNVDRGGNVSGRSWIWKPKRNEVTLMTEQDTISYDRNAIDSTSIGADRGFINDKFWLLIPFQLAWDEDTTITDPIKAKGPISNKDLNKITLAYGDEGGYTPGDAYDIFYDEEFVIREWVFRQGNNPEPSMTTTFENYKTINGLKLATDHKTADGGFNLFFSDIKVN